MSGRPSREAIMTALFNTLVASVQTSFTADTTLNSVTLANPSTTTGLFVGLPVFGPGVPRGAAIATLSPLTLDQNATAAGTGVAFTTGFLTFSRRLKLWDNVTSQPALFLRDSVEELLYPNTVLQQLNMKAEIWIYSRAGANPDVAPATALNNLLDAVQAAFASDNPMRQRFTLGGLVEWCRLIGRIEKEPGDLDAQSVAILEVEIIVP